VLDKAAVGADTGEGVAGDCTVASLIVTAIPALDESVLRGLLKLEDGPLVVSAGFGGETACDTAGRMPPSTAGLGRRVLCQS